MSNIIFPAGFTIELPDLDLEMMQHYAKQWNLEHTKMGKGLFAGSTFAVHTPRIQLAEARYSQGFMSQGDFPDGCIVLIFSPTEAGYNFQNRAIGFNEIIVLRKGDEIDILTSGEANVYSIVIEEKLFYQTFYDFFAHSPHVSIQEKRFTISPEKVPLFHQTINMWMTYLMKELPMFNIDIEYEKIEHEILCQLFNCMKFTSMIKNRKKFQTKKIRDLLHDNIKQPIDISLLSSELDISESQLHSVFKKEYAITPKKYLQYLRFNAIKKEFLLADPELTTVNEIAQKYKFLHMGHFSKEYNSYLVKHPLKPYKLLLKHTLIFH